MSDRVIIFDTTLRDGEQALSASLTVKEKLQIAQALERLGVDIMEVGFPSPPRRFSIGSDHRPPHQEQPGLRLARALQKTSMPPAKP